MGNLDELLHSAAHTGSRLPSPRGRLAVQTLMHRPDGSWRPPPAHPMNAASPPLGHGGTHSPQHCACARALFPQGRLTRRCFIKFILCQFQGAGPRDGNLFT